MGHRTDSDAVEIAELHAEIERLRAALTSALPAIESCMADDNPILINVRSALRQDGNGK